MADGLDDKRDIIIRCRVKQKQVLRGRNLVEG